MNPEDMDSSTLQALYYKRAGKHSRKRKFRCVEQSPGGATAGRLGGLSSHGWSLPGCEDISPRVSRTACSGPHWLPWAASELSLGPITLGQLLIVPATDHWRITRRSCSGVVVTQSGPWAAAEQTYSWKEPTSSRSSTQYKTTEPVRETQLNCHRGQSAHPRQMTV